MCVALVTKHCKRLVTQKKEGKKNGFYSVWETLKTRAFSQLCCSNHMARVENRKLCLSTVSTVCLIETRGLMWNLYMKLVNVLFFSYKTSAFWITLYV